MFDLEENLHRLANTHISYPFLDSMELALKNHFAYGFQSTSSQNMAFIGGAGSGKTDVVQRFVKSFNDKVPRTPDLDGNCAVMPLGIVTIDVPSDATIKGMLTRLLRVLGDPAPSRGTTQNMCDRYLMLLEMRKVKGVVLDEVHHLVEKDGSQTIIFKKAANAMKDVLKAKVPMVFIGTETVNELLDYDEHQLRRRTPRVEEFKPFKFRTEDQKIDFQDVLSEFERNLKLPKPSDIGTLEMATRFHFATRGYIGFVYRLLKVAIELAHEHGQSRLTKKMLALAYHKGASKEDQKLNPFLVDLIELTGGARSASPAEASVNEGKAASKNVANINEALRA